MRATLWLVALFGVAVAVALFAGNNQSTVTVYWPPYRVDLSLNMVLLLLFGAFAVLHAALRALAAMASRVAAMSRLTAAQRSISAVSFARTIRANASAANWKPLPTGADTSSNATVLAVPRRTRSSLGR